MGWTELRSSAVIGTARRAHVPDAVDGHPIAADVLPSTEERALAAAALLGTQHRAGVTALGRGRPTPPSPDEVQPEAPSSAAQLLDLALAGNLGRPAESNVLVAHWLDVAAHRGVRVPHRHLVALLARATSSPELQDPVRAVLGQRGWWLADQREDWSWVQAGAAAADDLATLEARFATTTGAERRAVLTAVRQTDPWSGRELLAQTWTSERATERAGLLGCLRTGLGTQDDPFLEAALDDKAKSVREEAASVLDRLPTSRRATRLADVLRPLISYRSGILRKRVSLGPLPEGTDLSRDLPTSTAQSQRSLLVRSAPLSTWIAVTGLQPDQLALIDRDPGDLLPWWTMAVEAQADPAWILIFGLVTRSPRIMRLLPGPWSLTDSRLYVERLRDSKQPSLSLAGNEDLLAERLHPGALPDLEAWRRTLGDDDRRAEHALRHIQQLVSTRSAITEAFS